jgi:hypothetical protein
VKVGRLENLSPGECHGCRIMNCSQIVSGRHRSRAHK